MEIVVTLLCVVAVLFGADRLMLGLERRGHLRWRRSGRHDLSAVPETGLDALFADGSRRL
ncbi:hypothetical protein [Sinosporangium siamense]|nr:hypothetical protein [Sinosporangium siamense]